jgi:hypothetical protein
MYALIIAIAVPLPQLIVYIGNNKLNPAKFALAYEIST